MGLVDPLAVERCRALDPIPVDRQHPCELSDELSVLILVLDVGFRQQVCLGQARAPIDRIDEEDPTGELEDRVSSRGAELLEGAARVDALGFLAAVEDNRQESQTAEVYAAAAIGEATAIDEPTKAGSLLLLQARILNRIGFPIETDVSQAKGAELLEADGREFRILAGESGSIQGPAEAKWGYTTLSVADWDHDGLLDLVVNSIWGKVVWFRNEGTAGAAKLAAARGAARPADLQPGQAHRPPAVEHAEPHVLPGFDNIGIGFQEGVVGLGSVDQR